jgi:hypothetical protein
VGRVDAGRNRPKFKQGYIENVLPDLERYCLQAWGVDSAVKIFFDP